MMSDRESLSFLELYFFSMCCYTHAGDSFCFDATDLGDALELHTKVELQQEVRIAITIKTTDNGGIYLCLFGRFLHPSRK